MKNLYKKISGAVDSLENEMISFIQKLVRIPSLPGQEEEVQEVIEDKLKELKLEVTRFRSDINELKDHPAYCDDGIPPEKRISVIGLWKAKNKIRNTGNNGNSLILNGHTDVVPPGREDLWQNSPWSGEIKNGKLYGRGSADMKAGLTSGIYAVQVLNELGFTPWNDIIVESVAGEESGGIGTLTTLVKGYLADAAIIMEPTGLNMCPVQAGAITFRIKVTGKSAHACKKHTGVSAIDIFYKILSAIYELEKDRHKNYSNPVFPDNENVAPISFGTIKGGEWHSTVPDELIAEGRFGVFPGESLKEAKKILEYTINNVAKMDPWMKDHPTEIELFEGQFESGQTNLNDPLLKVLGNNHNKVTGKNINIEGVTYGSDLRLFTNYGKIPAVLYGPGNVTDAHAVNEHIDLQDVKLCTKVLACTIIDWCRGEWNIEQGR